MVFVVTVELHHSMHYTEPLQHTMSLKAGWGVGVCLCTAYVPGELIIYKGKHGVADRVQEAIRVYQLPWNRVYR